MKFKDIYFTEDIDDKYEVGDDIAYQYTPKHSVKYKVKVVDPDQNRVGVIDDSKTRGEMIYFDMDDAKLIKQMDILKQLGVDKTEPEFRKRKERKDKGISRKAKKAEQEKLAQMQTSLFD